MSVPHLLAELRKLVSPFGVISSSKGETLRADPDEFYLYKTKVSSITRFGPITPPLIGFGFSGDADLAELKSVCEALERFCGANYAGKDKIRSALSRLSNHAVDPVACLGYSDHQYSTPGFPLRRIQPGTEQTWVSSKELGTGRHLYIHADLVAMSPRSLHARASSIGMAIHREEHAAIEAALLELIERDHLAIAFWHGAPLPRIRPANASPEVQRHLDAMYEAGYEVACLHMNFGLGVHVVLWLAFRESAAPYLLKGAAAHFEFGTAKAKAFDELLRSFLHYKDRPFPLVGNAKGAMKNLMHYQRPDVKDRLGFLLGDFQALPSEEAIQQNQDQLVQHMSRRGFQVLAIDMTHELVARSGLRCVRVIVPGLVKTPLGSEPWQLGLPRLRRIGDARDANLATTHEPHFFS